MQIGEFILPDLRQNAARYALKQPFDMTKIDLCQLGTDAIAMGAATLVLEPFFVTAGWQNHPPSRMRALVQARPRSE